MNRRAFLLSSAAAASRLLAKNTESDCDVLVVGGGVGGFAAAIAACRSGMKVVLSEETNWIGGQLTAQAVPPDEHPWIESFGSTRSYRNYRTAVREYYRRHYPLSEAARSQPNLNPGNGGVSRLTHEFRVSVAVLEAMLAPYEGSGQLTILRLHVPRSATVSGDRVTSVVLLDLDRQVTRTVTARYIIDATELGDLIALTNTESVTGAESQKQTGEMHACSESELGNSQSFTYCFAVDYLEGEDHTIERPSDYAFWRDYVPALKPAWTGPLLSWSMCDPKTLGLR